MISLNVQEYCHECPRFEPVSSTMGLSDGFGDLVACETIVKCKDAERCKAQYDFFKRTIQKE